MLVLKLSHISKKDPRTIMRLAPVEIPQFWTKSYIYIFTVYIKIWFLKKFQKSDTWTRERRENHYDAWNGLFLSLSASVCLSLRLSMSVYTSPHADLRQSVLTHMPLYKMAAVSQTTFLNAFSWKKKVEFWINFTEVFPKGPIDNNQALVWIMAWRRIGDKSLSEPMLTRLWRIYATLREVIQHIGTLDTELCWAFLYIKWICMHAQSTSNWRNSGKFH